MFVRFDEMRKINIFSKINRIINCIPLPANLADSEVKTIIQRICKYNDFNTNKYPDHRGVFCCRFNL